MDILSEKELAGLLELSPWTIQGWRLKSGLPYFRIGSRVFYRLESVEQWIKEDELRHSEGVKDMKKAICN